MFLKCNLILAMTINIYNLKRRAEDAVCADRVGKRLFYTQNK